MAKRDILPIFPSRANSVIMKQRVLAARRGVGLLKRKRDAIDMKLRELKRHLNEKDELVDEKMRDAIFSMAKARLLGADFKPQIVSSSKVDTTKLRRTQIKIVGVTLNCLELEMKSGGGTGFPLAGLSCGGVQVHRIRETYIKALTEIAHSASIVYQVRMLEAASLQTNMRVNALEHVVIPILQNTSVYITGELEEFEREDFYRLKRSQAKQLEAKLAFSELIKTKNMNAEELAFYMKRGNQSVHPVADVHFDDDEFEEVRVKMRIREARKSSIMPRDSTVKFFATSFATMEVLKRQRNPSAANSVEKRSNESRISTNKVLARSSQFRERLVEQLSKRNTAVDVEGSGGRSSDETKSSAKNRRNTAESEEQSEKKSSQTEEQSEKKSASRRSTAESEASSDKKSASRRNTAESEEQSEKKSSQTEEQSEKKLSQTEEPSGKKLSQTEEPSEKK